MRRLPVEVFNMRRDFAFFSYKTKDAATGVFVAAPSRGKLSETIAGKPSDAAVGAPQTFGFSRYAQSGDDACVRPWPSADAGVGVLPSRKTGAAT